MKKDWILAIVRLLSASALFIFLAQSNEWLLPVTATILVLSYRLGIFLTAPVRRVLGVHTGTLCFITAAIGSSLWYFGFQWPAIICLALGLAIGGYLIKEEAATTSKGAAWVAMAMNAGSLLAGALIATAGTSRLILLGGGTLMLAVCAGLMHLARPREVRQLVDRAPIAASSKKTPTLVYVAWGFLGAASGILVFSIFSVLPQTILASQAPGAGLPSWYGWLVSMNAVIIVATSLPVAKLMRCLPLSLAFAPLFLGLLTLMMPRLFSVDSFPSALLWVLAISLCETGLSHMDHLAAKAKVLLIKEACFGLGASLCVLASRWGNGANSGYIMGLAGIGLAAIGFLMLKGYDAMLAMQRQAAFCEDLRDMKKALL